MSGRILRAVLAILAVAGCSPPAAPPPAPLPPEDPPFALPSWSRVEVPPPPPVNQDLVDLGERLYGWNCFPCHGGEGKGDGPSAKRQGLHPRDLSRGLFMLKTSRPGEAPFDDDLYRTIAVGIPLGGMPVVKELEPNDRWALVAHLRTMFRQRDEKPTRWIAPPKPSSTDAARGKVLFDTGVRCAACHGPRGKGDGPSAPELRDAWERPTSVPDLTRGGIGLKSGNSLQDVFRVVTLGMAGTPMPSFESLPEKDRWDLAAYVVSLYEPVPPGERVYLRSGCAACHHMGHGKHVGPDLIDVRTRRDRAWLREWLKDPPGMMSKDMATRLLFRDYAVQMPNLNLAAADIDALIDYFDSLQPAEKRK